MGMWFRNVVWKKFNKNKSYKKKTIIIINFEKKKIIITNFQKIKIIIIIDFRKKKKLIKL